VEPVSDVRGHSFEEVRKIVGPVAARYGVEKVYLFGSRARGDEHEGSDYDFFIIPGKLRGLIGLSGLTSALMDALGAGVDIVPDGSVMNKDLSKEISRDRRLVYEA